MSSMRISLLLLAFCLVAFGCQRKSGEVAAPEKAASPAAPPPPPAAPKMVKKAQSVMEEASRPKIEPARLEQNQLSPRSAASPAEIAGASGQVRNDASYNNFQARRQQALENQKKANESTTAVNSPTTTGLNEPAGMEKSIPTLRFQLSKTACEADCEAYRMEVLSDGTLRLTGLENTRYLGVQTTQPLSYQYQDLNQAFLDFMKTEPAIRYPAEGEPAEDASAYLLEYPTEDGELQSITVYSDAPEAFTQLWEKAEALIRTGRWRR